MRPLRCGAAILIGLLLAAPVRAQREKREPLSEAQIEQIREAGIYPDDRVNLYTKFLNEHADAALHATQHLARDCSDSYGVVRTIGLSHSVTERFARFLLETAADGEVSNGTVRVRLSMTHEEISQLVGTSRETITRLLSEFRRNAMAELRGSTLIIHNHPALKHMVGA